MVKKEPSVWSMNPCRKHPVWSGVEGSVWPSSLRQRQNNEEQFNPIYNIMFSGVSDGFVRKE